MKKIFALLVAFALVAVSSPACAITIPLSQLAGTWQIGNGAGFTNVTGRMIEARGSGTLRVFSVNEAALIVSYSIEQSHRIYIDGVYMYNRVESLPNVIDSFEYLGNNWYYSGDTFISIQTANNIIINSPLSFVGGQSGLVSFSAARVTGGGGGGGGSSSSGCNAVFGILAMFLALPLLARRK